MTKIVEAKCGQFCGNPFSKGHCIILCKRIVENQIKGEFYYYNGDGDLRRLPHDKETCDGQSRKVLKGNKKKEVIRKITALKIAGAGQELLG